MIHAKRFFGVELNKVKTFSNNIKIKLQANDNKWPHEVALIQRLHTQTAYIIIIILTPLSILKGNIFEAVEDISP